MAEKRDYYEVLGVDKNASAYQRTLPRISSKKHTESLPKKITPIFIPATKSAKRGLKR